MRPCRYGSQHAPAPVRHRDMVAEALKQTAEQPLHFLMSAGPIWASRYLTAVPWYGWAIVPVLAYREWRQWPSKRWWDPPLDAAFLLLGTIVATWQRGGSLNLLTLRWQQRPAPQGAACPASGLIGRRITPLPSPR